MVRCMPIANSNRLQAKLERLGIHYIHRKDLAPSPDIRQVQYRSDNRQHIQKRKRKNLDPDFVHAYETLVLKDFDSDQFFQALPANSQNIVLFCVEAEPAACHRSILAKKLSEHHDLIVEHILPWKS